MGTTTGEYTWKTLTGEPTHVIAHRGASGLRPEHTMAAYELAIDQGADWIEPDLVMTRDGVLICRHDRYLSTTTDVADKPEFADRRTEKVVDGAARTDWWAEDFTLAEIRTLRARQSFPGRSNAFDGQFEVPTFVDVIDLARKHSTPERTIGILPETKHPAALAALDLDMTVPLLAALDTAGWTTKEAPVIVQSFEPDILKKLRTLRPLRLVQLVYPADAAARPLRTNIALEDLAEYADGVGPNKYLTVAPDGTPTRFIEDAHALNLTVYPWTFRNDQPAPDGASAEEELKRIFALGADGIFTDFPETALSVRQNLE